MRVGLVYNLKRGETEEAQEPPSSGAEIQAEWDDADTIEEKSHRWDLRFRVLDHFCIG